MSGKNGICLVDNINTATIETRSDIVNTSFLQASTLLENSLGENPYTKWT